VDQWDLVVAMDAWAFDHHNSSPASACCKAFPFAVVVAVAWDIVDVVPVEAVVPVDLESFVTSVAVAVETFLQSGFCYW
jgi:hypothetical protein